MRRKEQRPFYFLIVILLLGGLYINAVAKRDDAYSGEMKLEDFPMQVDEWQGEEEPLDDGTLNVLKADVVIMRNYKNSEQEKVWLYIGYHRSQKEGALIHSPRHCYPGSGWEIDQSEIIELSVQGDTLRINKLVVNNRGQKRLVLYWYQSQGQIIANEFAQRFYMIKDSVLNGRSDGALVRISAPITDDEEATFATELRFLELFYPKLLEYVPD